MSENEKKISLFTLIFFIIVSVPIFILAFYNVPAADDYTFSQQMYTWTQEQGYHIAGVIRCAIRTSVEYYFKWQGRYSESFFAAFMPEIFGCYWISAIIIYMVFAGGVITLFRNLAKALGGKESIWIGNCTGVVISMAIIQNVPFPVEAFFWFDGSMAYMFHHAIYIWMCSVAVHYLFGRKEKKGIGDIILLCILTIVAAGGNNVTSFISVLTYVVFVAAAFFFHKRRGILFPAMLSFAGFLVSYLSPGTSIRGGDEYSPILITIQKCFIWTIRQYLAGWTTPAVVLLLIFLTPLIMQILLKMIENYDFQFPFPVLAAAGMVCFLSAMSSPSFYVLGEPGPGRMRNVIYVNFIILFVLTYGYLLGWLVIRFYDHGIWIWMRDFYKKVHIWQGISMAVIVYFFVCAGDFRTSGVSVEAVRELVTGEALSYYNEAVERKTAYLNTNIRNVEVEPYSVKPYLLFFDDITDDVNNWKNIAVSTYYGKESVWLNRYDPEIDYE